MGFFLQHAVHGVVPRRLPNDFLCVFRSTHDGQLYLLLIQPEVNLSHAAQLANLRKIKSMAALTRPSGSFSMRSLAPLTYPMATRRTKSPRCAICISADCARSRNVATSISLIVPLTPNNKRSFVSWDHRSLGHRSEGRRRCRKIPAACATP